MTALTRWQMRRRISRLRRFEDRFLRDAVRDSGFARQVGLAAARDMRERRHVLERRLRALE